MVLVPEPPEVLEYREPTAQLELEGAPAQTCHCGAARLVVNREYPIGLEFPLTGSPTIYIPTCASGIVVPVRSSRMLLVAFDFVTPRMVRSLTFALVGGLAHAFTKHKSGCPALLAFFARGRGCDISSVPGAWGRDYFLVRTSAVTDEHPLGLKIHQPYVTERPLKAPPSRKEREKDGAPAFCVMEGAGHPGGGNRDFLLLCFRSLAAFCSTPYTSCFRLFSARL